MASTTLIHVTILITLTLANLILMLRFSHKPLIKNFLKLHSDSIHKNDFSNNIVADVIVIGGGHAGCEAAAASARTGANTVLLTQRFDTIGEMSCNPSIGGIGKGHLVREIDALDGIMGKIIDNAGIHFKMLNLRKGPAVRGPRAQADRDLYKKEMQSLLSSYPNLRIVEATAEDLILDKSMKRIEGLVTKEGTEIQATQVVITTGTFLRGKCYLGQTSYAAGRHIRDSDETEPPSIGLALTLDRLGFPLGRLKTGTPPRLLSDTINWDILAKQYSDLPPPPFSYLNIEKGVKMIDSLITCSQTYTNEVTHDIVRQNQHLLPKYDSGNGNGVGPRYCPSLFKKVERFPDRDRHVIWLEPEGLNSNLVYPNGLSGPFPLDVQTKIIRSIKGLEECVIAKAGYDVEYDYIDPRSLHRTLQAKQINGLFLAGQICGTTGYEEAAAQGIIAGANAGLQSQNRPMITIGRDEGYIGVLIDDLVMKGTNEPYRMFTSRAEYRLTLRQDNADIRLTRKGYNNGLVSHERLQHLIKREQEIEKTMFILSNLSLPRLEWSNYGKEIVASVSTMIDDNIENNPMQNFDESIEKSNQQDKKIVYVSTYLTMRQKDGKYKNALDILSTPNIFLVDLIPTINEIGKKNNDTSLENFDIPLLIYDTIEATAKYSNYIDKQNYEKMKYNINNQINTSFMTKDDYNRVNFPNYSNEEIELLKKYLPKTLYEASQIQGITPECLLQLYNFVSKRRNKTTKSTIVIDNNSN